MKFSLFCLSVLLVLADVSAQSGNLDSLQVVAKNEGLSAEQRITVYSSIAHLLLDRDPENSIIYADSALALVGKSADQKKHLPALYLLKGAGYSKQSKIAEALTWYNEALTISKQLGDSKSEAKSYTGLAIVSEISGELVESLTLNQKALDLFTVQKDTAGIFEVYNSIGIIYWDKKEHSKALEYYKKALDLNRMRKSTISTARILNNIGLILNDNDKYDSALIYFKQALQYIDPVKSKFGYALINNNLGIAYRALKQYDLALRHFNLTRKLQLELNDLYGLALVNMNIGQVLYARNQFTESVKALKTGLDYAEKAKNLDLRENISNRLASAYEKMGDYKTAFYYQKQNKILMDSLQVKSLSNELAELEVKYKVKQQQAENDLLKTENELNTSTIQNRNILIWGASVFSVLVLALLVLSYRALRIKQKTNKVIEEKNRKLSALFKEVEMQRESIQEQKNEIASQNEELAAKNKYLEDLNYEKSSLMGIVAHDLKAPLNSIGAMINILPEAGTLNNEQKELTQLMISVIKSSRSLIQDLMDLSALENNEMQSVREPVDINQLIHKCLTNYAAQANQKGIDLEISERAESAQILSDNQHIERILQNLVSNALKFSKPDTRISLGAKAEADNIQFYVSDQGPGLTDEDKRHLFKKFRKLSARPTQGESSNGLGLSIVKALMNELGGIISVESKAGMGTTFTCRLPLK